MTKYREGFRGFLLLGTLLLVAYFAGGWALWKVDQGKIPPIVAGEVKDGLRRDPLGEEKVMPHSWSPWYQAPEYGLACDIWPREAALKGKFQVRFEDGSLHELPGRAGKLGQKVVAGRFFNGSVLVVRAKFFTWNKIDFTEGDVDRGERLEKVTTLKLAPDQWSDWIVQPEGSSGVIANMDNYAEAVVKCALRLADGTVQVVPASERWSSGQAVRGIRLRNEGVNPVEITVLAWRALESSDAGGSAPEVPPSNTSERPPESGVGWRREKLLTVVLPPYGTSAWVDRPSGCWGVMPVFSDASAFRAEFYLANDQWRETYNANYHFDKETVRARAQNAARDHSVEVTFYTWRKQ